MNVQINDFKKNNYKKRLFGSLRCNSNDKLFHLPAVLLSNRKFALSLDNNFTYGINNFPRFRALAEYDPSLIPYR
jgi:hypothetical protein